MKTLRLSEKWFNRGLWLVALVFAQFLIGLGGTIVKDLPKVENSVRLDDYVEPQALARLKREIEVAQAGAKVARNNLSQATLQSQSAQANNQAARAKFENWLATRAVTQKPEQDQELITRTKELDGLRQAEREALARVEAEQKISLDASQAEARAASELQGLRQAAQGAFDRDARWQELRVFLYRLALTLPLLLLAGWLFVKKRKSKYWPFVWGFIFFAVFGFFVELVPYLPSYGGVVRYLVGIAVTVVGGRYAILAIQKYIEDQKQAEALPDNERRKELDYDLAHTRLSKGVCPGCERPVDIKDVNNNFCQHCGLGIFTKCVGCETRKSAFARYCHSCGAQSTMPVGSTS